MLSCQLGGDLGTICRVCIASAASGGSILVSDAILVLQHYLLQSYGTCASAEGLCLAGYLVTRGEKWTQLLCLSSWGKCA